MMRVLLDTNVVLDVLLDRQPFAVDAQKLWKASDEGLFDASIASFTIPTIHYICRKQDGIDAANHAVDICVEAFEVCALYRECILAARRMTGGDFEDNLQIASAITDFMQGIVTRNPKDFASSPIRVYTPAELLAVLQR
jgi:predicted nucleic acid-binding protein